MWFRPIAAPPIHRRPAFRCAGNSEGGAGMVITKGDSAIPTALLTKQQRGAAINRHATKRKRHWLFARVAPTIARSRGHMYCQVITSFQSGSTDTSDLRPMLDKRVGWTTLLWIPGHYRFAGNEEVDACVTQVTTITNGAH